MLWMHLRVSPLRWVAPLMTALGLAILFLRDNHWIGVWPETGAAAQIPAFFMGMLAAGAAAWVAGAPARQQIDEQLAAKSVSSASVESHRLGAAVIWLTLPYFVCHLVAFAVTARTFPPGLGLWAGYAAMGLTFMLLSVAWGWLIGRYLNPMFASVAAVLSWFVIVSFPLDTADIAVVSGPPWQEAVPLTMAVRLGAAVVLLAALLWLPSRGSLSASKSVRAFVSVTAAAALVGVSLTMESIDYRGAPDNPLCIDGAMTYCLYPEHEKYADMVMTLDERVQGLPAAFELPPDPLVQHGFIIEEHVIPGASFQQLEGDLAIIEGSPWSLAMGLSTAIVQMTFADCDLHAALAAGDYAADQVQHWLETHLAGGGTPDYAVSGVPEELLAAWNEAARVARDETLEDQFTWVEEQIDHVREHSCG